MSSRASYSGQKSEILPGFHRRPRQDDAPDALAGERIHRRRHREIGLAGAGRPDADDDVVIGDRAEVLALAGGFRLNHPPQARQNDLHEVRGGRLATFRKLALRFVCHHALDVVDIEVFAHAREIDQRLGHRARALDRRGGSRDGQRIPTQ